MVATKMNIARTVLTAAFLALTTQAAVSADLPQATQNLLKQLGKKASLLAGVDKELAVPQAWIAAARKEGAMTLGGSWDHEQYLRMIAPFSERYPFIKIAYNRASRHDRVMKPLIAFRSGRILTDVIQGVGGRFHIFQELKAVVDMRNLPGWNNIPDQIRHPEGYWIGFRLRHWCMAYNTKLVAKKDLPKTWDDIVSNPRWHNKKIGLGNRPNLWLANMWGVKGEGWAKNYMKNLFGVVKPQLRKEGMNALVSLVVAGEFHASMPSAPDRVTEYMTKGAPVAWHCPEPVPTASTGIVIVKGTPHLNASRLFVNWLISKEGQLAQYGADGNPPAHKDMQSKDFLIFPDEVVGKETAFLNVGLIHKAMPQVMKAWNPLWLAGRGIKLVTLKTKIEGLKRKGRRVVVKNGGKTHTLKVSDSRTKIIVGGVAGDRTKLKVGMSCEIVYPGKNREEAKKITC
ncbi:MAG: ABC-type Fe3+ transport system substrate-binding protein [Alphaproteobacteria bacterium]|jgi:ABC-type Fe3+ transport system substrate-binding protein